MIVTLRLLSGSTLGPNSTRARERGGKPGRGALLPRLQHELWPGPQPLPGLGIASPGTNHTQRYCACDEIDSSHR